MQAPLVDKTATLECPNCGKHALVSPQAGIYQCLNCSFERDLTPRGSEAEAGSIGSLFFACAGFLITCIALL